MSVWISWQDDDPDDRPEHAAPATGQADAAEHDRRDAQQRVRSGDRASRSLCWRSGTRPPNAANRPVIA